MLPYLEKPNSNNSGEECHLERQNTHMPEHEEKDIGAQGMADKVKGKAKEYTGKAQKQMGKVTGSREQQIKGKAREVAGGAEAKGGDVERKVDKDLDR